MVSVGDRHDVFHALRHTNQDNKENIMTTQINWFEIPVTDLPRAARFYETVLAAKLNITCVGPATSEPSMAIFNNAAGQSAGCLLISDAAKPTSDGVLVYLYAGPSIQQAIDRIVPAGGKVVLDKLELPNQLGYIARFIDTEGNRVALHAMQ
jgi:predicted enzyme related to lactoylglutathione lyase